MIRLLALAGVALSLTGCGVAAAPWWIAPLSAGLGYATSFNKTADDLIGLREQQIARQGAYCPVAIIPIEVPAHVQP